MKNVTQIVISKNRLEAFKKAFKELEKKHEISYSAQEYNNHYSINIIHKSVAVLYYLGAMTALNGVNNTLNSVVSDYSSVEEIN